MRFRPSSTVNASASRSPLAARRCSYAALLLVALAGCSEPVEKPVTRLESEAETTPGALPPDAYQGTIDSPPALVPPPPPVVVPPPPPQLPPEPPLPPETVAVLNARFHAKSAKPEERDEIIQALGRHEAPQALPALRRIFDEEKRLDLRLRVLEVAGDATVNLRAPGRWELFARATEATQPALIRLSALQTLADSEDPRVLPLLKQLARDTNSSIRENAARILKERQR